MDMFSIVVGGGLAAAAMLYRAPELFFQTNSGRSRQQRISKTSHPRSQRLANSATAPIQSRDTIAESVDGGEPELSSNLEKCGEECADTAIPVTACIHSDCSSSSEGSVLTDLSTNGKESTRSALKDSVSNAPRRSKKQVTLCLEKNIMVSPSQ